MNTLLLAAVSLLCLLPFVNLFVISISSSAAVAAGEVAFIPTGINATSYEYILQSKAFGRAITISFVRVLLGVLINVATIILTAYPLSKSSSSFRSRSAYSWFFVFTMLFAPSMIPAFMVVRQLGLLDTIWALVLPCGLPVFSMIVMLNFFRSLPRELEEAALTDGAGHFTILFKIYLPTSAPAIATITLFSIVFHWNSWFDGMLYMNTPTNYPLQSYLQTIIVTPEALMRLMSPSEELLRILSAVNNKTLKAAQLFVSMIPVLAIYPFLQKYFTTGLVLGSVKE